MRFSGWLLVLAFAVVSLTIACGDSSGPPGNPASVVLVSGDAQPSPVVGTKLPLPLVVKVSDAQGKGLAGITVIWVPASGIVSAPSSKTAADGTTSVEWTLGTTAGSQTATATVKGLKAVTFTAAATAGPVSRIILSRDTVELLGIGDTFRLNARAADQFGNVVQQVPTTVESADPSIVTADNFGTGAILTARTTDKTTTVRATAGSIVKTGTVIILPPPCAPTSLSSTLAVGELALFQGAAASEFCVQGTASGAEFIAIPFYSDFNGSLLRLSITTGGTTIGAFSSRMLPSRFQRVVSPAESRLARDEPFEIALRERSINELTPLISGARAAKQKSEGRFSMSVTVPALGDILKLNTNSTSACANPFVRAGRVVAISNRAIIVSDTTNPASGFTTADYEEIGAAFDTLIYPVDTLNFGSPTDIDNNQHVILFFTRAVNELTPPASAFYVGGFFFSRDLFPTTAGGPVGNCAASNFAEMFYLLSPDPDGVVNQNVRTVEFVKLVTLGAVAHEFQHLINASRHLYVNASSSAFEDVFLDEGLAHVAEELMFFRSSGLSPGQNISYNAIHASPNVQAAFDNFGVANFRRFREYLTNTLTNSPYANNANITTRGAIWSFLRYAADRRGGNERQMWFELANPPAGIHGVGNITRAVTQDLGGWVRDWAVANYVDDYVPGVARLVSHPSWNIRSMVEVVNEGMWALATQQLDSTNITSVGINDGSAAYLRFGVRPGTVGGGRITARGAPVPAGFALSVIRTK